MIITKRAETERGVEYGESTMNSREESTPNLLFLYCAKTEITYGEVEEKHC
jgi:hypothetical protein